MSAVSVCVRGRIVKDSVAAFAIFSIRHLVRDTSLTDAKDEGANDRTRGGGVSVRSVCVCGGGGEKALRGGGVTN